MSTSERKIYPYHYPTDVLQLLSEMSFSNGKNITIIGSASKRELLYSADYDVNEVIQVQSAKEAVKGIQKIIQRLLLNKDVLVGDFKAGVIEEWMPVTGRIEKGKVKGYSATKLKEALKRLDPILTPEERRLTIPTNPTPAEFLSLVQKLRIGLVRWSPSEILKGSKKLRDGRVYTLEQAIQSPAITKLDISAYVKEERFVELSIIYVFKRNGKSLNEDPKDTSLLRSLRESIIALEHEGNYFKMAKRIYSLAGAVGNTKAQHKLAGLFNSDVGRLYSIVSDMDTLSALYDSGYKPDRKKVETELDNFRVRLGYINLPGFREAQKLPTAENSPLYRDLHAKARGKMNEEAGKILKSMDLLPLPVFLRI